MKLVSSDRGQIGIGTLIVFIALVLVAAIAAGVLINSADLLQERGENTSEDSVSEVSDQIVVTSTFGTVLDTQLIESVDGASIGDVNDEFETDLSSLSTTGPGSEVYIQGYPLEVYGDGSGNLVINNYGAVTDDVVNGNRETQIHELKLNVRTASGADEIDLREATIDFLGEDDATFTFSDASLDPKENPTSTANHGDDFVVEGLSDSNFATILRDGNRAQITLGLLAEDLNGTSGDITDNEIGFDEALDAGETAELRLVTNGGAETFVEINVPETLDRDTGETVSV